MYRSSRIFAIVVLLDLLQLHDAAIQSLNHKYSYPHQQINYNDFSIKEGIFVYAVCDTHDLQTEKSCTVIQRRYPYDEVAHSCNITLRVKHSENFNMTGKVGVHAFGTENAIVLWAELGALQKLNLMTIRLDSCKTNILELDDPVLQNYMQQIFTHKILTYDDNYDIFLHNTKSATESDKSLVGMRVNFNSEPQPTPSIVNSDYVIFLSPIATRSPDKGFVYSAIGTNGKKYVTLLKPDGTEKILMSKEGPFNMVSANYDFITSCAKSEIDTHIECTQFNENGDVKFDVTYDPEDEKATEIVTVHTTPHGGFLLMTRTYEKSNEEVDYSKIKGYDVLKVNSDGRKVGSVRLNGFEEPHTSPTFSVWENGDKYCVTLVSRIIPESGIVIVANCLTEQDFSV